MGQNSTLRSALPLLLLAILLAGAGWACFGDRGLLANRVLATEVEAREARLEERQQTIARLVLEIDRIKTDPLVQERWIREELGYVRKGEVLYLFPSDRSADFAFLEDRKLLPALGDSQ
ncbi:MAG: septum formation initiator family protein [Myxococcota bacterium]|nr:septum formation initiator family protein [Myxococcota bacterium]